MLQVLNALCREVYLALEYFSRLYACQLELISDN
ncbi:hypothetical protein DET64_1212 [Marinobacter nauticus]|uniref:Uncharacterized protein n=1 Tax=Marinobacter nauticus TaxID=2743 RepID=A0ABX9GUM1_MARNT|nr:hypothetical protein DET64_1212 [Marinobacter nauticus]